MTHAILLALAPIFFVLALGFGAGRMRIVDNLHVDGLNALVMNFALPASLFAATASAPRSEMFAQAPLFAILGAVMLVLFLVWYFGATRIFNESKANASLQALTIAFPNLAGVGLPIMAQTVGPSGAVPLAIALASGSVIVSPLSLIIVEMTASKKGDAAASPWTRVFNAIWHALTKPVVLAPALGILFSLSGLQTGTIIDACLRLIGQAAPGVALFLTGLILSSQAFRLDWRIVRATAMADIIRPLLAAAVVFSLPISAETAKIAVLLAAVPSGFFGILFAVNYRLDSGAAGSMVTASTIFSIVTMAIAIAVLFPQ
jgi:malonate transporter and related proteins